MRVFWTPIHNVGDDLTPYLVKGLFNQPCILERNSPKWLMAGSILHYAGDGDTLAGCGSFDRIKLRGNNFDIRFVRGPLTAKLIGRTDILYGDAGLLMPLVFKPDVEKKYDWGIVVHFMDFLEIPKDLPNVLVISPRQDPQIFITQMCQCRNIMSSSLHGIILSETYGIPAVRMAGDRASRIIQFDYRNRDYYEGTNRELPDALDYKTIMNLNPEPPPNFSNTIEKMVNSLQQT